MLTCSPYLNRPIRTLEQALRDRMAATPMHQRSIQEQRVLIAVALDTNLVTETAPVDDEAQAA